MTKLLECTCSHEYQDRKYGGQRVHNYARKANGGKGGWRCTVCGKVKEE